MRKFCYCLILIVSLNESIFSQRDKDEFSNPTFTSALNKYADKKYSENFQQMLVPFTIEDFVLML